MSTGQQDDRPRHDHPQHEDRDAQGHDLGLTHVALCVTDLDASLEFYAAYAAMEVVHRRTGHDGVEVAWISDRTRPFVVVLIEHDDAHRLGGWSHLGVGVHSREQVDAAAERARSEGRPTYGPTDSGPPVGYYVVVEDPDGHQLELAFGQDVGLTVDGTGG